MRVLALITIFFVILCGLFGSNFFHYADAQKSQDLPKVLLQLQIRNSDGQLVAYVEGTKIVTIQKRLLNEYLDTLPNKRSVIQEEKRYELFQWQGPTEGFDSTHAMTMFLLNIQINDQWISPLLIIHNSYQVEAGDTVTVFWTVMRPVR